MSLLFSEGRIGNLIIKNRSVMPAMGTNMSHGGMVNKAIINHYEARAKGGAGLIIVEVTCVDAPLGLNTPDMLRLDEDKYIDGHRELVKAIHRHDSKAFIQLSHTGRGAKPDIIGSVPVSPSSVAMPYSFMMGLSGVTPRELTRDEIYTIEDKYAQAALRAQQAGYDGVEIHACGYYLCQQFLSYHANRRNDEYGGSRENRIRFLLNIVAKINNLCGKDYPIIVKISLIELGKDKGISLIDGIYYSHMLEKAGVSAIEVLAGAWNEKAGKRDKPETGQAKGIALPLCTILKLARVTNKGRINFLLGRRAVTVPLIGGGRTFEPQIIERALRKQCEFVFMGRGFLAEPNLIQYIKDNKVSSIRPCIGCNQCVNEQLQFRRSISCSGSPAMGYKDNDYTIKPTPIPKNIIVVGGGPAGAEAARTLALRGHKVTLMEKSDTLGGQVKLAILPPYKYNVEPLIEYYNNQLSLTGVNVMLNTEATKELLQSINPDGVVFATGTKDNLLNIKGIDKATVLSYKDVFKGMPTGRRVLIIGGGTIGCELAEMLARARKKVTIVEMTETLATKMPKTAQSVIIGHLNHLKVKTLLNSVVIEINSKGALVKSGASTLNLEADNMIICVGDRPNDTLYKECKDICSEVYNIGDSDSIGDIKSAVRAGYLIGISIK